MGNETLPSAGNAAPLSVATHEGNKNEVTISGRAMEIGVDRSVWLGKWPGDDDSYAIEFRNGDNKTQIRLSGEAIVALGKLQRSERSWRVKILEKR